MKTAGIMSAVVLTAMVLCGCNQKTVSADPRPMIWELDYNAALKQAAAENKYILMYISGMQWCHFCQTLDAEILSQPEFLSYAKDNLVCVQMDFDIEGRATNQQFAQQNEAFLARFMMEGFPAVFIFSPQGRAIARDGYRSVGPVNYVAAISRVINADKSK
jgi:thioredoxin-related protein